jgi:flavin reductase (DIM6/NTAB) family NADH-FMN oxidoreductase RutF
MPVDEQEFRFAMSHFPSGVTVVTTKSDGMRYGMTVASFASLSLKPPLVLVCLEKNVQTHGAIISARHFGVSILRAGQQELSARFASKIDDRFDGIDVREGMRGAPLIADALASMQCNLIDTLPGGDHTIFIGEVDEVFTDESKPLVYFRSGYHDLSE